MAIDQRPRDHQQVDKKRDRSAAPYCSYELCEKRRGQLLPSVLSEGVGVAADASPMDSAYFFPPKKISASDLLPAWSAMVEYPLAAPAFFSGMICAGTLATVPR